MVLPVHKEDFFPLVPVDEPWNPETVCPGYNVNEFEYAVCDFRKYNIRNDKSGMVFCL